MKGALALALGLRAAVPTPTYYISETLDRAKASRGQIPVGILLYSGPTRQVEYASTWPLSVAMTVMSSPLGATNISLVAPALRTLRVPVQSALTV